MGPVLVTKNENNSLSPTLHSAYKTLFWQFLIHTSLFFLYFVINEPKTKK